jgi:4-hydroxy-3-methylbut-2-enyl diphosphate reductase IspH
MESQMLQLSQQVAQLAIMVNQAASIQPATSSVPTVDVVNNSASTPDPSPQEVDPVISRLSSLVDDF